VVRALIEAGRRRKAVGEIINVGTGKQISVNRLLRLVQQVLRTNIPARYAPSRPGDAPRTCADPSKAKKLLGIKTFTPLRKGLEATLPWFRENLSQYGKRKSKS
jgi:nucleoside-diphosphate-sugar epimerase